MVSISVIIPVHQLGTVFARCLGGIARSSGTPDEVIVVADGVSGPDVHAVPGPARRIVALSGPGGPARARNAGARLAAGDILLFIDADVVIHADAVDRVRRHFDADPELAAVIGSYDDRPSEVEFLSEYRNLLHHFTHQTGRVEAATFWGACGAVRRDVFLALGGFDERYRKASIEDVELGYRLTAAGRRIRLDKALQVTHLKRWTLASLLRTDIGRRGIPWTELTLRAGRVINDLNLNVSSRLSVALVYGLLTALAGAWWWRGALVLAWLCAAGLLAVNAPLYVFFWRARGFWFALRTIPWHWLYFFYSGLAFGIGAIRFLAGRRHAPQPGPAADISDAS